MLVEQESDKAGDADGHVKEVNIGDAAEGDDSAAHGEVPTIAAEQSIPSPPPPTPPPQPPQDIPLTSQVQQTPPQSPQLKRMVKKLEKRNKVRVLKLRRLQKDDAVVLKDDKEVADYVKDVEKAKEDETMPAKVQEVVDVVTIAKLITEVIAAASETIITASAIITTAEAQVHAATTATLTAAPVRVATAPSRRRK
nr:hypothetical protein [Tanacetum cinerariifolium]